MKPAEYDTELTETNKSGEHVEVNGINNSKERPMLDLAGALPCPQITWGERIKKVFLLITVEPFLLCYIVSSALSSIAVNRLNTEKACRVDLNYTEEICIGDYEELTENYNISKNAESQALLLITEMTIWQSPLQKSIPAIMVLFVGAWSDRTGNRKALMLIPLLGEIISSFGLILATYFFLDWPLWVTALIEAVPTSLLGGINIAIMGSYSYIADVTTEESRTFRIGLVTVFATIGNLVGSFLSGVVLKHLGYYGVFCITFTLFVIGFIHTSLRIHNVKRVETTGTLFKKIKEFFHPKNIWDTVSIIFQSHGRNRIQIILVLCAHIVMLGPSMGVSAISFQYLTHKYSMDEIDLSLFNTYSILLGILGTMMAIAVFSKRLKMHDTLLGMIATTCMTVSNVVYGLVKTKQWLYLGPVFNFFGSSGVVAIRSLGTKVVAPENIAKICSLIGLAEVITELIYIPMYAKMFKETLKVLPGAVLFIGAVMTIPAFFIFVALYIMFKRQERDVVKNPASKETYVHDNDVTSM